jgi:hypothetical protein
VKASDQENVTPSQRGTATSSSDIIHQLTRHDLGKSLFVAAKDGADHEAVVGYVVVYEQVVAFYCSRRC